MRLVACGALCLVLLPACSSPALPQNQAHEGQQTIRRLIEDGRYAEARALAESVLEAPRKPDSAAVPDSVFDELVFARWKDGYTSPAAVEDALRAVKVRDATAGDLRARSLRNLGLTLLLAARTADALKALQESVDVLEATSQPDPSALMDALNSLGLGLIESARYDDAERTLDRALALRLAPGSGIRESARALELLSLVRLRTGRYAEARDPLDRAMSLRSGEPTHPDSAMSFWLRGDLLWLEGQPTSARDAYARCVSILERALRADHPDTALCVRSLGNMLVTLGDTSAALTLLNRAVGMAERSLGPDHPLFSGFLNDVAVAHIRLSDYRIARTLYERALAIRERHLGADHLYLATIVFNLAAVSGQLGDLNEAKRQFERAIAIWSLRLGPEHPFVARGLASLARTLAEYGHSVEALALQRKVLAMRERTLGGFHPDTAETLGDLARTLSESGHSVEAATMSARAIGVWEGLESPDSRGLAEALKLRADVLAAGGAYASAQTLYARALDIAHRLFGLDHPTSAGLRVKLADAAYAQGALAAAFENAAAAEKAARGYLQSTIRYLPEREALTYTASRPSGLNLILSIASDQRQDATSVQAAFDAVIGSRAIVLDEVALRHARVRQASDPTLSTLWNEWTRARQRLANLTVRGAQEQSGPGYRTALDEARRDAEAAERRLAEKGSDLKGLLNGPQGSAADVQRALSPSSAVVSYVKFERVINTRAGARLSRVPTYVAFIVSSAGRPPALVPLGTSATIEGAVLAWRREASRGAYERVATTPEARYKAAGGALRELIWDPIVPHLNGAVRVFVVPDGAINTVSLAALPATPDGFLLEHGPVVHYVATERDLLRQGARAAAGHGLFALGGAAFSLRAAAVSAAAAVRGTGCDALHTLHFSPLAGTLEEVSEVAERWNTVQSRAGSVERSALLSGPDASERTFKQRAAGHRVLHLATHGFFLDGACGSAVTGTRAVGGLAGPPGSQLPGTEVSPLLLSGLALAGANQRDRAEHDEDDGILTAEEIAAMNLEGTEWAVLSACDTGLGEIRAGEGVFGLRRAFQVAGVRTVIMSLWSVDDQATRQWMRALYEARLEKHLDTADSVRAASLNVLQDRRAKGLSTHPFYWAAFVAAGDWR